MVRVDSAAVKYHREDTDGLFRPVLNPKHGFQREWNLGKLLGSHENAHIAFTLSVQAVMGAFLLLTLGGWLGLESVNAFQSSTALLAAIGVMLGLTVFGLFKLMMHLGKPQRFYRGFYNLRASPVSREIAGVSIFLTGLMGYSLLALFEATLARALQNGFIALGLLGIGLGGYYMYKLYRIPARPFWNHWHTGAAFAGTGISLGALLLALVALVFGVLQTGLAQTLLSVASLGLALEGVGLFAHARDLKYQESEGAASVYEQTTTYGYPYWLRNGLLATALLLAAVMAALGTTSLWAFGLLTLMVLFSAVLGRALFYVVVIPTTMPGAFFWKNKGFIEHAREVGLADMPQLGVAHERHHPFDLGALLETLRTTTIKDVFAQTRRILTG